MIRFFCECGKQLQAREENAGKLARCPACNRQLTVPLEMPSSTAVQIEEPVSPTTPPERMQKKRPALRDESELEEPSDSEDRPYHRYAENSGKAIASLVLSMLALFCNFFAGLPALILGILALRDIGSSKGRVSGKGLAITGIVSACLCTLLSCGALFFGVLWASVQKVREAAQNVHEAAERAETSNSLKRMAIAMHNYNDLYGTLPPAAFGDPDKPPRQRRALLSWRVAILRYLDLDQQALYNRFKLDEPWDSPHNIKLLAQMPAIYKLPGDNTTPPDHTHYQVFVGDGAAFDKTRGYGLGNFTDGLSNTILIVEAENAVPWTKPEDVPFNPNQPIVPLMSRHFRQGFHVALADGSVRLVVPQISERTLKAAITRNGNDKPGPDW